MNIVILPDTSQIADLAATFYTDLLEKNPKAVLGLATGSSPVPTYKKLIELYERGEISFKDAKAFLLDEYVGLPADHPQTYITFIKKEFTDHVDFAEGAVQGPPGSADDPFKAAAEYEKELEKAGGIDLQMLGIGSDGHIAFNEPGGALSSVTHLQVLAEQTREDNARFFDDDLDRVPKFSLTQGLSTIMRAKKIILIAQGEGKAEAVAALVEGGVSARWQASILQYHNDVTVLLDEEAASKLQLADFYTYAWESEQELRGASN